MDLDSIYINTTTDSAKDQETRGYQFVFLSFVLAEVNLKRTPPFCPLKLWM